MKGAELRLTCLPPIIEADSRVLILGTMPGAKSLEKQQYYANPGNQFWRIIYGLYDQMPSEYYAARLAFVKRHHIALWDVLKHCSREGSSDGKIRDIEVNDIGDLIAGHPQLKCLAFSSQKAHQLFDTYIKPRIEDFDQRPLAVVVLPSPSGQNARLNFKQKLQNWQILKEYLET